jgi:hypothetical protein
VIEEQEKIFVWVCGCETGNVMDEREKREAVSCMYVCECVCVCVYLTFFLLVILILPHDVSIFFFVPLIIRPVPFLLRAVCA